MNEVFNVSYNTTSLVSSNMKNGVFDKNFPHDMQSEVAVLVCSGGKKLLMPAKSKKKKEQNGKLRNLLIKYAFRCFIYIPN